MKKAFDLKDYIEDIELNGMRGRMVNIPAQNPKSRALNILFIHGQHSSQERSAGALEFASEYGNITAPDLPGFGGMDHFYSIGLKPTIDNLAEYLATFIKFHYGTKKKFVIVGYSYGFLIVARMLQMYPDLHSRVVDVVSMAGLVHRDDFTFTKTRIKLYILATYIGQTRIFSWLARELFFRRWSIGTIYTKTHNAKKKFSGVDNEEFSKMIDFEVMLWRVNHFPTWCYTIREMFKADLVKNSNLMPLSLIAVTVDMDQYFDNKVCEQHFRMLFDRVRVLPAEIDKHGPSVVATADGAKGIFPKELLRHLRSLR